LPIYEPKKIEISDEGLVITYEMDEKEILSELPLYLSERIILTENVVKFLEKNISELKHPPSIVRCLNAITNNGYKIDVSGIKFDDEFLESLEGEDIIVLYNSLKKLNALDEDKEKRIIEKLADRIYQTLSGDDIEYVKTKINRLIGKNLNSNRELMVEAIKLSISQRLKDILYFISEWLTDPRYYQSVSGFIILIKILKENGLENIIQKEIEEFRNKLLNNYIEDVKKVVKNRIKNDKYKEEMRTLIGILQDRSLYKYLL